MRNNWDRYFAFPTAPKSYTKPESRAAYESEKRAEQARRAPSLPFSGYVAQLSVVDHTGKEIFAASSQEETAAAAIHFVEFVHTNVPGGIFQFTQSSNADVGVCWFGLGIRDVMQTMAVDVMRWNALQPVKAQVAIPPGMWYHRTFSPAPYTDPYEMLVPSAQRSDIDLPLLCEFLGIGPGDRGLTKAKAEAQLVYQLAKAARLCPELV